MGMELPDFLKRAMELLGGRQDQPVAIASSGGMDRVIARKPAWRRYAPLGAGVVVVAGIAAWALAGAGGNV